ncbi:MAG: glutamate synthase subunit beta [Oligoflexus sp.]|nr:glutamate synthase subunit beta [Oligoflexus sp.]
MGEVKGFLEYPRQALKKQPVHERIHHYKEFVSGFEESSLRKQGARCMDCGVAFCHNGCPLGNLIPSWNQLVSEEQYRSALELLLSTNNFPEFTGRICPAPCESACVLGINDDPVAIEGIEMALADMGFAKGWIKAERPSFRSGKKVAIIGSGPSGLAAAQQLNRAGHSVVVFERSDRPGGLLMYGIPDFKLEKSKVERRIRLLEEEGISFRCSVNVGHDITAVELREDFDAILIAAGAAEKRDIKIRGREFKGVHFADDLLSQSTHRVLGDAIPSGATVYAADKDVIVIGGGDTGSDCVGTSRRQGARSITQFEIMTQPPKLSTYPRAAERPEESAWPAWTHMLRTSGSHEEGANRHWSLETVAFEGDEAGHVKSLITRELAWFTNAEGRKVCEPVPGSEKTWPCQMAMIAVGFTGAERKGLAEELGLEFDSRGNLASQNYASSQLGVFAAGDARRGQSLVVWAIAEGREAAKAVNAYLQDMDA